MQTYFVDTWFLIARTDPLDRHHRAALRLQHFVKDAPLVTHDAVLTEYLTFFSQDEAHERVRAAQTVREALARWTVVPADRALFLAGLDLYERRRDKQYSLVDCMSMQLMKAHGLNHVLTNDHHFQQEGFVVVNDAP